MKSLESSCNVWDFSQESAFFFSNKWLNVKYFCQNMSLKLGDNKLSNINVTALWQQ